LSCANKGQFCRWRSLAESNRSLHRERIKSPAATPQRRLVLGRLTYRPALCGPNLGLKRGETGTDQPTRTSHAHLPKALISRQLRTVRYQAPLARSVSKTGGRRFEPCHSCQPSPPAHTLTFCPAGSRYPPPAAGPLKERISGAALKSPEQSSSFTGSSFKTRAGPNSAVRISLNLQSSQDGRG